MKRKIMCVGIISMFLLTGFITVSAVDMATVVKGSGGSINDAVDNYDLTFTNSGEADWFYQTENFYYDSDAAKSDVLGYYGATCVLETNIEGSSSPKILRYNYYVDSCDALRFYLDENFIEGYRGPPPSCKWGISTIQIPGDGYSHNLKWEYREEYGNSYACIDHMTLRNTADNARPYPPGVPSGWGKNEESIGRVGREYSVAWYIPQCDPDGDDMHILIDWGDGTDTGWLGPYVCYQSQLAGHKWTSPGTYEIKCILKDDPNPFIDDGLESDWSGALTVTIKKGIKSSNSIFLPEFFERFPNVYSILKQLQLPLH